MPASTIILVRHGLTDWSVQGLRLGSSDIPLNEKGLEHAQLIATALKEYPIARIYHSGMQRTKETARAIASKFPGLEPQEDIRLRERDHGTFEGSARETAGDVDTTSFLSAEEMAAQGVEPLNQVWERAISAYQEIRDTTQAETVVIVSHYGPIRLMLAHALGLNQDGRKHIDVEVGSISIVKPHGDWDQVSLLNSVAHLPG